MERRIKEAVRYLGYGRNAADERTLALIEDAFAELERTAAPKSSAVFLMSNRRRMAGS